MTHFGGEVEDVMLKLGMGNDIEDFRLRDVDELRRKAEVL